MTANLQVIAQASGLAEPPGSPGSPGSPGLPGSPGPAVGRVLAGLATGGRRRLRVVVIGNFGNGNIGDEAVLAGLLPALTAEADVTVLSRRPQSVERMHGVRSVRMMSADSCVALLRTDVVAVGGGGIFGAGLPRAVALLPFVLCAARLLLGKRLLFQAIGIYPDTPRPVLAALRVAARLADRVLVRDSSSVAALQDSRFGRRLDPELVYDPAIDVPPTPPARARSLLEHAGGAGTAPLLISVKPTPDPRLNQRMVEQLTRAVDYWTTEKGGWVAMLPMSVRGDYGLGLDHSDTVLAERIRSSATCPERVVLLPEEIAPGTAKSIIGLAAGVIGVRLHAQIFAWSMACPLLGLPFEAKSYAFLQQVGATAVPLAELEYGLLRDWMDTL